MKKSLLFMACCLTTLGIHAQDDDVYFVPSSKENTETLIHKDYNQPSSDKWNTDYDEESDWSEGRGNGSWDEDSYNRRKNGKHYDKHTADENRSPKRDRKSRYRNEDPYSEGYEDGYQDGLYTSRLIRFWSPRIGIYVSSPYYWDYYTAHFYDPWWSYGPSWSWTWSWNWGWNFGYAWNGWGYCHYPHWHYGYTGWYDPWYGYPHYGWNSHWYPSNAQRGPVGGYIAYGNVRGTNGTSHYGSGRTPNRRPSGSFGRDGYNYRGTSGAYNSRPSRNFGNRYNTGNRPSSTGSYGNRNQPSRQFGRPYNGSNSQSKPSTNRKDRPSRNNYNNRPTNREFNSNRSNSFDHNRSSFGSPSRSGFGNRGGGFGGGGRSGGGRSFGGRR